MQSSRGKERKDEKGFINEQSKEVEENNGKGKTRDLFKNIGDTEGMFHVRMGTIKEETVRTQQKQKRLRRGGKNTQKSCTKKGLNDPENHNGVVTHLEPDIPAV